VVTQRPAKPFTPVRFRSSPLRRGRAPIRTVAVFGGNSEIALAIVAELAAHRLDHAVLAVRDPENAAGVDALRAAGVGTDAIPFDAERPDTHAAAVDGAFAALDGRDLDLAVVAFALLGDQERAKRDASAAVQLATTNFVGAVSVLTILAERLEDQGHGAIVVLSSVAAERPRQANYPYGATKAGLDAFAQGLSDALARSHVHVLVARPGWVRTKMTKGDRPKPLATDPQSVAKDVVAGLHRGAHTVWSPRALRPISAAMRLLPRPVWRRIRS
jgi:decaprenylphospho-beta-D-erythro-pentofuranosid-2-ulose 2-reductase